MVYFHPFNTEILSGGRIVGGRNIVREVVKAVGDEDGSVVE